MLDGQDCAVNAVNYYHNLTVMAACLRKAVPYVDLGGLFHMTRRQLSLDGQFREAGVTVVIGVGADPGITNVHAAYAARRLRTIESIRNCFRASVASLRPHRHRRKIFCHAQMT